MSDEASKPRTGTISWIDLTVDDAEQILEFYSHVVGWHASAVEMGDYSDFNMNAPDTGEPIAGVCHARGSNAGLPAKWMIYIVVDDVEESAQRCIELGGKVIVAPKGMGSFGRYCVIEDPAGAVAALFEPVS